MTRSILLFGAALIGAGSATMSDTASPAKTVYEFTVKDIDGKDVSLSKYKGDVLLIVNVASL